MTPPTARSVPRLLAVLLLTAATAGCGLLPDSTDNNQMVTFPVEDREAVPDITGETLDGEQMTLADYDGVTVVNFWASWCGPCLTEAPHLNAVATAYEDRGVAVLGVNAKDDLGNAQAFATSAALTYPSWFDPEQQIAAQFGSGGPVGLPTTIILDDEHRVAVRFFGSVRGATLSPAIDAVLAETAPP